jgi:gluconokinase
MVGTSGAMRVVLRGMPPDHLPGSLWCYRVDRERVVIGGALSDGGGLYRWLLDSLAIAGEGPDLEKDLAGLEADSHGLTVLPFWSGERSTGWSTNAKGAILGLTQDTKPVEIVRAAMEGVAYRFAMIARDLEPMVTGASVIATGNALRASGVWRQMMADVLGRPVRFGGPSEASLRGAALLALEAVGKIGNIEELQVNAEDVVEPDMSRHDRYVKALERQQYFYERVIVNA